MRRQPHSLQRACAGVLAALWLTLPLVALLHAAAHPHRYCALHQELEEASEEPAGSSSLEASRTRGEAASSAELSREAERSSAHERCALTWGESRRGRALAACEALAPPARLADFTALPGGEGLRSPVPLLALAPKASPPVL